MKEAATEALTVEAKEEEKVEASLGELLEGAPQVVEARGVATEEVSTVVGDMVALMVGVVMEVASTVVGRVEVVKEAATEALTVEPKEEQKGESWVAAMEATKVAVGWVAASMVVAMAAGGMEMVAVVATRAMLKVEARVVKRVVVAAAMMVVEGTVAVPTVETTAAVALGVAAKGGGWVAGTEVLRVEGDTGRWVTPMAVKEGQPQCVWKFGDGKWGKRGFAQATPAHKVFGDEPCGASH